MTYGFPISYMECGNLVTVNDLWSHLTLHGTGIIWSPHIYDMIFSGQLCKRSTACPNYCKNCRNYTKDIAYIYYRFSKVFDTLISQQENRRFQHKYPNILSLFNLILTIPMTSTACERGFTHLKLVKSGRRTHMSEDT